MEKVLSLGKLGHNLPGGLESFVTAVCSRSKEYYIKARGIDSGSKMIVAMGLLHDG